MNYKKTKLGAYLIDIDCHEDHRGFFLEFYHKKKYSFLENTNFVQDNISFSQRGTLRGLHFQKPQAQSKLIQVLDGEIFDVIVDLRKDSKTFLQWESFKLSSDRKQQLFIPEDFAHGFQVVSEKALFIYKCGNYYNKEREQSLSWNDKTLNIPWPIDFAQLSTKDQQAINLKDFKEKFV